MNISDCISSTIQYFADRPAAFSTCDVVNMCELDTLEVDVDNALSEKCRAGIIMQLSCQYSDGALNNRFLGVRKANIWWVNSTVRWSRALEPNTCIGAVTSTQLASAMSVAFDNKIWDLPPTEVLNVGREWAMVADGNIPNTFVFPWVSFLQRNPDLIETFIDTFKSLIHTAETGAHDGLRDVSFESTVEGTLGYLDERQSDIIRERYAFGGGQRRTTLEELGKRHNVTRERIRQLEAKALRQLRKTACRRIFQYAFIADFLQRDGSMLISNSMITPQRELLHDVLDMNILSVEDLDLYVVNDHELYQFLGKLLASDYDDETTTLPPFVSMSDGDRIRAAVSGHRERQMEIYRTQNRPRMIREALRELRRAAHYTEIAETCNRMFPGRQTSVHSWHSALSSRESEELGIVWVGTHGTYGLREHGYSRPKVDMHEAVAQIVEEIYAKTGRPVSSDTVISELSHQRRELKRSSVMMALSFNTKLDDVGGGLYVPRVSVSKKEHHIEKVDFSAAFDAFRTETESNG